MEPLLEAEAGLLVAGGVLSGHDVHRGEATGERPAGLHRRRLPACHPRGRLDPPRQPPANSRTEGLQLHQGAGHVRERSEGPGRAGGDSGAGRVAHTAGCRAEDGRPQGDPGTSHSASVLVRSNELIRIFAGETVHRHERADAAGAHAGRTVRARGGVGPAAPVPLLLSARGAGAVPRGGGGDPRAGAGAAGEGDRLQEQAGPAGRDAAPGVRSEGPAVPAGDTGSYF